MDQHIWTHLKENIIELGYTEKQIRKFKVLGSNCNPSNKLNRLFLPNLHISHSDTCVCGKKGIVDNFYVGIDRNNFVILGSKCYENFPMKLDFRTDYRHIK